MRFFYLRDENNHPIGCLASDLDKENDRVKFALSVCNPIDNFNKKQAQALAAGRIAMGDYDEIKFSTNKGKVRKALLFLISETMFVNSKNQKFEYPHRARDAAKCWLESHKEKQ